jgi:MFS family permease
MAHRSAYFRLVGTSAYHLWHHILYYLLPALFIVIRDDSEDSISLSYLEMGTIGSILVIMGIFGSFFVGNLADRFRRYRNEMMLIGVVVIAFHLLLVYYAENVWWLYAAAFVASFGAIFYHPSGLAIIGETFNEEEKGFAYSINLAVGIIGTAVAPFLSIQIAHKIGWRETSLLFFGVVMVGIILTYIGLKWVESNYDFKYMDSDKKVKQVTDPVKTSKPKSRSKNGVNKSLSKIKNQLLPSRDLITVTILFLLAISAVRAGLFRIFSTFITVIFKDRYSVSETDAGYISSLVLLVGAATALILGSQMKRLGDYKVLLYTAISSSASGLTLVIFYNQIPLWGGIVIFSIFSLSLFGGTPAFHSLLSKSSPSESQGKIFGIIFSVSFFFSTVNPYLFGHLIESNGFLGGFILLLILAACFLILILFLPKIMEKETKKGIDEITLIPKFEAAN